MTHWRVTREKLEQHHIWRMRAANPQKYLREEAAAGRQGKFRGNERVPCESEGRVPLSKDL